ncbi:MULTISPECIES: hypothetical protein [unclassified Coleofasciculus]|uniref:hypothetical protein n=1 Tax=unclassified Coleofasciculus TaxID=2692782 RepID=UPI001D135E9F|nr:MULTISPECIES: hypothetical protein [unclassified Coleofasciculus]
MPLALKVAGNKGKDVGQYILLVIPPLSEIVNEVWETAEKSPGVDFESFKQRAKANYTKVA